MEKDDDKLANSKTAYSDTNSLPASELEHFWLNLFDYLHKYICVHVSSINLLKKRTGQQQFPIFFPLFTFHQCNEEVFIQHTKNNKFKNRKEN